MSRRGVVIAVVVMLALGVVAWFALSPSLGPAGSASGGAKPIITFSPGDVIELVIKPPQGAVESVYKTPAGWRISKAPLRSDVGTPSWPIAGAQARGMLTILRNLTPVAQARGETLGDEALTVRIRLNDGAVHTLRFDTRSIGGRRLVQADDATPFYIDKPVYEALTSPGPMGWRAKSLLRRVGAGVSRISIESPHGSLQLARLRGVWYLRQPVRAPADSAAVDQLLSALASLSVVRWVDDESERTGAEIKGFSQTLRLTIERDRRTVDTAGVSHVTTDRTLLTIAGPADVAGDERYVMLGANGIVATLPTDQVDAIRIDPAEYAMKTAIAVSRSQIGVLEITRAGNDAPAATLTRTLDGWRLAQTSAEGRILPDEQVGALLDLLTKTQAESVSLAGSDANAASLGERALIQIFGFNHDLLGEVRVAPNEIALMLLSDGFARSYPNVEIPELLSVVMNQSDAGR